MMKLLFILHQLINSLEYIIINKRLFNSRDKYLNIFNYNYIFANIYKNYNEKHTFILFIRQYAFK